MTSQTIEHRGHPVVGFGDAEIIAPAAAASPWPMVFATSVVSVAAKMVLEGFASKMRRKRRR